MQQHDVARLQRAAIPGGEFLVVHDRAPHHDMLKSGQLGFFQHLGVDGAIGRPPQRGRGAEPGLIVHDRHVPLRIHFRGSHARERRVGHRVILDEATGGHEILPIGEVLLDRILDEKRGNGKVCSLHEVQDPIAREPAIVNGDVDGVMGLGSEPD